MTDRQLAIQLLALGRAAGADDSYLSSMQIAIDHSDPFYAIADGATFMQGRQVPPDVSRAYSAYRDAITDPDWRSALPSLASAA